MNRAHRSMSRAELVKNATDARMFESVDPARVQIPTGSALDVRYVANLTEGDLDEQEESDLGHIAKKAAEYGFELEESGVAREPLSTLEGSESRQRSAHSVNRATIRVLAYRIERERRAQHAKESAERKAAAARATCEAMLEQAPAIAAAHVERLERAIEAFRDVSSFLRKCELVVAIPELRRRHRLALEAAAASARLLKRDAPTLTQAPEGLPDFGHVEAVVLALFESGERPDHRALLPDFGPTTKADRAAREFIDAGKRAPR
ncbi:MAG TPA: hypothetical protein VE907_15685 [Gammaproteobacteria bacterium]|nr:hypothetical protein [Gammaproteobacteria bacterium]